MNAEFFSPGKHALPTRSKLASSRNLVIAAAVVALHAGLLWALQSGLLMRAAEIVIPVEVLAQLIEPPAPRIEAPRPAPAEPMPPVPMDKPKPAPEKKALPRPQPRDEPQPRPVPQAESAPNAPVVNPTPAVEAVQPEPPSPPAPAQPAQPVQPTPVAPAAVQLPSSDADYLQNPRPPYPPMSKRLGEQGKTTVRVLIGADGHPQRAEIAQSSGFDRLDQAAVSTVMRWRYVPGKRGGVPEAMWFSVPINWVLE